MSQKLYSNFVKPASPIQSRSNSVQLNGYEAHRLYLEEVKDARNPALLTESSPVAHSKTKNVTINETQLSDSNLFISAQNNQVDKLQQILNKYPYKINVLDDYGWSLLMIACQANSIEVVRELLKRNIDISITDKAGNSAQSLVIKNKNFQLATLLVDHRTVDCTVKHQKHKLKKVRHKEEFKCSLCNKKFPDKQEHLSSTVHNMNASKNIKLPANYVIPESNKGYQLMLKVGWDKQSGLGPGGSGKKYPIKTVKKMDRRGLGHGLKGEEIKGNIIKQTNKRTTKLNQDSRNMEINFRRQFY